MSGVKIMRQVLPVAVLSLSSALAMADCNFREGGTLQTSMPLLGVNLTVGRDIRLGSEVYRQTFQVPVPTGVVCSPGVYKSTLIRGLPVTPLPLSAWSGAPYAGKVYESGVPGIGVVVWVAGIALPFNQARDNCGGGTEECYVPYQDGMAFDLSFIKIGEVSPGTIMGSSLPTMDQKWLSTNTLDIQHISLSGVINVVSRTATHRMFRSAWVYGNFARSQGSAASSLGRTLPSRCSTARLFTVFIEAQDPVGSAMEPSRVWTPEPITLLRYRLDPTQAPVDAPNGVIGLNPSSPGESPAAGVGIQITEVSESPVPLSTLRDSGITTAAIECGSYSVP
jgi:hypothetical protein